MIEWGQKSKPKKIPGPNFNPQKSHAKFLSHKNFWKAETVAKQVWFYTLFAKLTWPGICGNYHESSDSFQYPPKSLLKSGYSSYPKSKIPKSNRVTWNPEYSLYPPWAYHIHFLYNYLTQCVTLVKCWKPWNFTIYPRSTINWVYFKPRQCLKFLRFIKKHFMLLEELNSRIHENGWLPCILFWLPCHSIKHSILHFPDFLHLFSNSDQFSGVLESLLHSSQLQRLLFIIPW